MSGKGIGGHTRPYRGASDIWLTPPEVVRAVGPFDLDPCAAPEPRPWATAARHYAHADGDGLTRPWEGFVWLNPPYGPETWPWLARLSAHPGGGIALTFARTETEGFFAHVWDKAAGLFFLKGRLHFHHPDGTRASMNAGGPSVLLGYTEEAVKRLARSPLEGHLVVASALIVRREDGSAVGSWRAAVLEAMAGRTLELRDLYAAAEGTAKVREAKEAGHNWRAQLRRTLQRHFEAVGPATWAPAGA